MQSKLSRQLKNAADKRKQILEDMPKIYFVEDFAMSRYLVGRTDWSGDQFDLVSIADFKIFRKVYEGLSMPLLDLTHED